MNAPKGAITGFRGASLATIAIAAVTACSIVNSYDDLRPLADGTYSSSDGGDVDGSSLPLLDGAPIGKDDATKPGAAGAIAVAGEAADGGSVLAVIDPATGHEIGARESMVVAGIRYDGLRDLWYVFESKSNEWAPGPNAQVVLHVRTLDLSTGVWTDKGAPLSIPPLQHYESIGVLRDRLSYVAHDPAGDVGAVQLVTIDTSVPEKPVVIDKQPLDRAPLGMVATRSSTGPGGVLGLVRLNTSVTACTGNVCSLELVPVRVPNGAGAPPSIDPPKTLGPAPRNSVPGFATFTHVERDLIVFPRPANDASTTAALFEPRTQAAQGSASPFFMTDSTLRRAAVSECTQTAFVIGTNSDLDLHAVPVFGDGGGTPGVITTGHSGQAVYFEPTSKTVLAPFGQGAGFDLSAFRMTGTSDAPQLARRTADDWNPPVDLRPILLGIRLPVPVVCP